MLDDDVELFFLDLWNTAWLDRIHLKFVRVKESTE